MKRFVQGASRAQFGATNSGKTGPADLFSEPQACSKRRRKASNATDPVLEHGARRNFLGRCHGLVIPTGSNDCIAAHFSAQAMMEMGSASLALLVP
jgi:hypothetical protein